MNAATELGSVVDLRPATSDDVARIMSDWLNSHWPEAKGRMRRALYSAGQRAMVARLLSRCAALVVCPRESPNHIIGWAVGERISGSGVVHYAYVKLEYRRLGFGRRLVESLSSGCELLQHTHETDDGRELARALHSTFNPFLSFGGIY